MFDFEVIVLYEQVSPRKLILVLVLGFLQFGLESLEDIGDVLDKEVGEYIGLKRIFCPFESLN